MTEQQRLKLKDHLLSGYKYASEGMDWYSLAEDNLNHIESILSPLPHQDGASAEEVLKGLADINWLWLGRTDQYDALKKRIAHICRDVTKAACIDEICINDIVVTFRQFGYEVINTEAMHQFAQSETAKVVAEKDREIEYLKNQMGLSEKVIASAESKLSTSNAHRTRLIESVIKWGGAWRKCRAELKEAKRRVKELEEHINSVKSNPVTK